MHLFRFLLVIFCWSASSLAAAKSVTAIALFNERAMLSVDGKKAKIVRVGESYFGVKLVSSNTSEAVIDVDGEQKTLILNGTATLSESLAAAPATSGEQSIVLYEDERGFYQTDGYIDGQRTNFLVDTGANIVVFSSRAADRIGIDYRNGRRSVATTASGRAPMYSITLESVSVGGIRLRNVEAGVIQGGFPQVPLLGMSFLGKLEINKKGNRLTLRKRGL